MFSTQLGSVTDDVQQPFICSQKTAGNFCKFFLNVQKTGRIENSIDILQTGKFSGNEIVARQFIFRMRI